MGGLVPRYLVGRLPEGVPAHVGTTDVDLVVGLALSDELPETYATLQTSLKRSGFKQVAPSYRWTREVEGVSVAVEFLCETDQVEPGFIFRPKDLGEQTGTKLGAFNVRGANLARDDFVEVGIEAERLDGGGSSEVAVRVANVLPYVVLKIFAYQDRHENKDAYDLVFTLLNHRDHPRITGEAARVSPVAGHPQVEEAMALLEARFRHVEQDGPTSYSEFLADVGDGEAKARLRQQAVAVVREFLRGWRGE